MTLRTLVVWVSGMIALTAFGEMAGCADNGFLGTDVRDNEAWVTPVTCWNGVVDPGELCDSIQVPCRELGLGLGMATCIECGWFDTSTCDEYPQDCGDGHIDEYTEACDGGVADCRAFGFQSGIARCATDCLGWDLSGCCGNRASKLGNGVVDEGEICDGGVVPCEDFGAADGVATCREDGLGYDVSKCRPPECGDGSVDGNEECDPPGGAIVCNSIDKFYKGSTVCSKDCRYELDRCKQMPGCGNGIVEEDEACESFSIKQCSTLGYESNDFAHCAADCSEIDTSTCGCLIEDVKSACDGLDCDVEPRCGVDCGSCDWENGFTCIDNHCVCDDECDFKGQSSCDGENKVRTCVNVAGCLRWQDSDYCGGDDVCYLGKCGACIPDEEIERECGMNGTRSFRCSDSRVLIPFTVCEGEHGTCHRDSFRCVEDSIEFCEEDQDDTEWVLFKSCNKRTCHWLDSCEYSNECSQTGHQHAEYCEGPGCATDSDGLCVMDWEPADKKSCSRETDGIPCGYRAFCKDGACDEPCPGKGMCTDGSCRPLGVECDGNFDCLDASDEQGCPPCGSHYRCPDGSCQAHPGFCAGSGGSLSFRCGSGTFVDYCSLCDGTDDCSDGDDENWICREP